MSLTEKQIDQLYKFTRAHFVEHYDVQTELVDHLANGIEEQWKVNKDLSFDEALKIEFKKFGVFGFMDVIESKSKALSKKYQKLVWNLFKGYFRIPQIVISFTLFLVFLMLIEVIGYSHVIFLIPLGIFLIMLFKFYKIKKLQKERFNKTQKKWLLEDFVFNIGSGGLMFNFGAQLSLHMPEMLIEYSMVYALFLTVFVLLMHITVYELPKQIDDILAAEYPEYSISQ